MIQTTRVIKHFGSVAQVADFFGIRVSAVYQWGEYVPHARELELMLRLPDEFAPQVRKEAAA